jgi:hypothetical protein
MDNTLSPFFANADALVVVVCDAIIGISVDL